MYLASYGLASQQRLDEGTDQLLAWAEEIDSLQKHWALEKDAFLAAHGAMQTQEAHMASEQQARLANFKHAMDLQKLALHSDLMHSLADSKSKLLGETQQKLAICEEREQAMLRRHRLERCRLKREAERLALREEQLAREGRERERQEKARLEAQQARTDERRARLEMEKVKLKAELDKDRALWRTLTTSAIVQTDSIKIALESLNGSAYSSDDASSRSYKSSSSRSKSKSDYSSSDQRKTSVKEAHTDKPDSVSHHSVISDSAQSEVVGDSLDSIATSVDRREVPHDFVPRGYVTREPIASRESVNSDIAESIASSISSVGFAESVDSMQNIP